MINVMVVFSPESLPLLDIISKDPLIRPSIFLDREDPLIKLFDEYYDVYVSEGIVNFVKRNGVKVAGLAGEGYRIRLKGDVLRVEGKCEVTVSPLTSLRVRLGDLIDVDEVNWRFDGVVWGDLPELGAGTLHLLVSRERVKYLPGAELRQVRLLLMRACSDVKLIKPIYVLKGNKFVMSPLSMGLEALDLIKECEGIPIKASRRIKVLEG